MVLSTIRPIKCLSVGFLAGGSAHRAGPTHFPNFYDRFDHILLMPQLCSNVFNYPVSGTVGDEFHPYDINVF